MRKKAANARRIKVQYKGQVSYDRLLQILHDEKLHTPTHTTDKDGTGDGNVSPVERREERLKEEQGEYMQGANGDIHIWTIGDLIRVGKHTKDYFKKKWEKKSETRQAYAMINAPIKLLRLEGREAFAKIVDGTVEDVKSKYAGAQRRKKVRDMLLNETKPHYILAAMILSYDMSGTLYADSYLQDLQGSRYIWFEKVAASLGLDPKVQLALATKKVYESDPKVFNMNHLPEEELIKTMFKLNQETNDYVQAVGGGAKIWKMADEYKKKQVSKGEEVAVEEGSTDMARADLAVKKMESNEFEIALGAFNKALDKGMGNDVFGPVFSMVMGGAPAYLHHSTLDAFAKKQFSGFAFHGFAFVKTKAKADLYRKAVEIAVKKSGDAQMQNDFFDAMKTLPSDPFAHEKEKGK